MGFAPQQPACPSATALSLRLPSPFCHPECWMGLGGPPKNMKIGQRRARMRAVWNGEGRLRSGLSEAVPECGLDGAF